MIICVNFLSRWQGVDIPIPYTSGAASKGLFPSMKIPVYIVRPLPLPSGFLCDTFILAAQFSVTHKFVKNGSNSYSCSRCCGAY